MFCKAEAIVLTKGTTYIEDQRIEDKLQNIGQLSSPGASDSNSDPLQDTEGTINIKDQCIENKLHKIERSGSPGASDSNLNTSKIPEAYLITYRPNPLLMRSKDGSLFWSIHGINYPMAIRSHSGKLKNGQAVDKRCYPDLQQMIDDCRAAGLSPVICSSYCSRETQERLFNNKVTYYTNLGYSLENAKT